MPASSGLFEQFARPTVATRPEPALGTNGSFRIIHALFMWTPDDPVCHNNRLCPVILYELQDFAADNKIGPYVLALGEPAIQGRRLSILLHNNGNCYLRGELIIRPVKRDGRDRIASEPAAFAKGPLGRSVAPRSNR